MFYGIIGVTAIAFSCSTEFIPELNEQMKLVPFKSEFKTTLTTVMILDFVGCYLIEIVFKAIFSDLKARDIAHRRPEQIKRENDRKAIERVEKDAKEEQARLAKVEEFERKVEEKRRKIQQWSQGNQGAQASPAATR